jgi:Na+/H+-dicarboxylate symporter
MPISTYIYNRMVRRVDALVRAKLWAQVLVGLVLGVFVGLLLGPEMGLVSRRAATLIGAWLSLPGQLFLGLVGMIIIPLLATSIMLGIAGAGGGESLRSLGWRLAAFIILTTAAAAALGAGLVGFLSPGELVPDLTASTPVPPPPVHPGEGAGEVLENLPKELPRIIVGLIPQDVGTAIIERDFLPIVLFSVFLGVAVVSAEDKTALRPLLAILEAILAIAMTVVKWAMFLAPFAVFGLFAELVATTGAATLLGLAAYMAVVVLGLFGLYLGYVMLAATIGRMPPLAFMRVSAPVQLLAFSTSSSAAVMPLSMQTAVNELNVLPSVAGVVIPLGATMNMAGTALYQSAAITFLAQISGIALGPAELALIIVTLSATSIGAPAAPGASVVILSSVAAGFGIPVTGLALILGVDRLLDMARTAVNVTGDLVACRIIGGTGETGPGPAPSEAAASPQQGGSEGAAETPGQGEQPMN